MKDQKLFKDMCDVVLKAMKGGPGSGPRKGGDGAGPQKGRTSGRPVLTGTGPYSKQNVDRKRGDGQEDPIGDRDRPKGYWGKWVKDPKTKKHTPDPKTESGRRAISQKRKKGK